MSTISKQRLWSWLTKAIAHSVRKDIQSDSMADRREELVHLRGIRIFDDNISFPFSTITSLQTTFKRIERVAGRQLELHHNTIYLGKLIGINTTAGNNVTKGMPLNHLFWFARKDNCAMFICGHGNFLSHLIALT